MYRLLDIGIVTRSKTKLPSFIYDNYENLTINNFQNTLEEKVSFIFGFNRLNGSITTWSYVPWFCKFCLHSWFHMCSVTKESIGRPYMTSLDITLIFSFFFQTYYFRYYYHHWYCDYHIIKALMAIKTYQKQGKG